MEDQNSDVKRSLDDIFGDDVIEIDTDDLSALIEIKDSNIVENDLVIDENVQNATKETIIPESNEQLIIENNDIPKENFDNDNNSETIITEKQDKVILSDDASDTAVSQEQDKEISDDSKKVKKNKSKFIIIILIIILLLSVSGILIYNSLFREKVANCFFEAEDSGFKITDEYKIVYKGSSIIYLDGIYTYTAKTEEFKSQIEYIKDEKIPVIVNSNGMSGFTYIYELGDDFFKVSSYLEFEKFKFQDIKKINQDIKPISYIKITEDLSYKDVKKKLEKEGYKCTVSK